MMTLYGIANCDTIKKAKRWLEDNDIEYRFHDYKKLGANADELKNWCKQFGFEKVVNQRGTTWRKLNDSEKADLNEAKAIKIMLDNTSIIKRPILDTGNELILGFSQSQYESLL